jgi:hypothetical protein
VTTPKIETLDNDTEREAFFSQVRFAAIHESSHAIVATLLGIEVEDSFIHSRAPTADRSVGGATACVDGALEAASPEDAATMYFAGWSGERIWCGYTRRTDDMLQGDGVAIGQLITKHGKSPKWGVEQSRRADKLVLAHERAIKSVAGGLLLHGRVDGAYIRAAVATYPEDV